MYKKDTILLFGYHLVSSCELADGNVQPDKQNGDFPQKKGGGGKVDVPKKSPKIMINISVSLTLSSVWLIDHFKKTGWHFCLPFFIVSFIR